MDKSKTYFDLSLPANESVPLVIHVTNNSEEAIEVAGGITLRDVAEEKTSSETKGMFKNKFAYAIELLVHGDKIPVENVIMLKKVTPTQVNSQNVVSAAIENKAVNYINKVSIEASVTDASRKEMLSGKKKDIQIAPSSMFQFPIYYKKQAMKAGKYTLTMTVRSEKQEWQLKELFTITKEKATALNKTDVLKKEENKNVQWLVLGLVEIIFLLLITLVVILKKKK